MRWHLLTFVALAGLALAQTNNQAPAAPSTSGLVVSGGYASTPIMAPTVVTPHVTLGVASANPVGATSSAGGLQVGATSAAIPPTTSQQPVVNQAVVSSGVNAGNTNTGSGPAATIVAPGPNAPAGGSASNAASGFIGAGESQPDVAEASRFYRTHPLHAVKVYTNDDINRLAQQGSTGGLSTGTLPASDVNAPSAAPSANSNPAAMPQADQPRQAPPQAPAPPVEQPAPKSKPAPYTPPATPPQ